jgi:hypothetical protein
MRPYPDTAPATRDESRARNDAILACDSRLHMSLGHSLFPPHVKTRFYPRSTSNALTNALSETAFDSRRRRILTVLRIPLSKSKPDRMIGSSSSGSGDALISQRETSPDRSSLAHHAAIRTSCLRSGSVSLVRRREMRRLHFPATDLSGPFLERDRIPASVLAVFPMGLRAAWFEATPRGACFMCLLRARQRACARNSLEASSTAFRTKSAHELDELRWVGMDDCDLPILSVFKDLHPRVAASFSSQPFVARIRLTFTASARLRFRRAPLRRFPPKKSTPPFDGTEETQSSPLTLGRPRPLRHALSDLRNHRFEPDAPTSLIVPEGAMMCSQWRYTPREPSRAHGKRVSLSHGFGLQRTQLTSTPASRTSAFTDGSVDPAKRTHSPRSTSVRAIARSLHRPRTNESLAHLSLFFRSHHRAPSFAWNAKALAR